MKGEDIIKTLLINGSPRKKGNTELLLTYCQQKLSENNISSELINLSRSKINHCLGCNGCSGKNKCIQRDDFNEIYDKLLESKGIILGTPVYVAMPTSLILAFIQRATMVSFANGKTLDKKVGGIITIGGEAGQVAAINDLTNFYLVNGMILVGSEYWNIGFASKKGDIENDQNSKKYVDAFINSLRDYIN